MRHFRTIILLTVLACTVSTTKSFAHDIEAVNADGVTIYYKWTNNQKELAVSYRGDYQNSYPNEYTDNVVIPESVVHNGKTYSVTSIGSSAFHDCSGLTSVTIPNSVTCIGYSAFRNCSDMTSVTIPNSVTSIEAYAFNGCSGLTSVTILNPITSIGSFAFNECNCLMSIKVRVTDYTAFCNNTRKSSSKPITLIDEDGQEITRFVIPDDVTSIEQSAFYDCSGLTSVTIPNSVTSIGQSAFLNCSGLTSVTIPNSVTSIGRSAFKDCTSLESVTIGDGVQSIDGDVFGNHRPAKIIWLTYTPPSGYSGAAGRVNYVANDQYTQLANKIVYKFLSSIFEVDGVKYVPVSPSERTCDAIDYIYDEQVSEVSINPTASYQGINMKVLNVQPFMFYQNINLRKASIDIPGSISMYAFNGCKNLQTITLGNSITCIDEYAFSDCTNMASVIVGDGTETIGAHAFENCSNLTSATIGNSTRFIQQYAFSGCTLLPAITIPGSVRLIDDYTFQGCKNLKEIVVKVNDNESKTTLYDYITVQLGVSKTITIDVAKGEELSFNSQWWQGSITVSFLGKDIPYSGGTFKQIFNKGGKVSITLKSSNKPRENSYCTITNMKLIESGSLLLGSNGNSPIFVDCPLDSVFIDRDLAYRSESTSGYSPFYNNKFLRSIEITNNGEEISDNEFFGCSNLQNVQIGNGVTTIGDKAFSGCSGLKSFSFGTNVSNIGKEAFSDCTALTQLISHAATPPVCGSQALDDINKWTCKLTIPYGCLGAYQAANQWKEFFFIEEGEKPKGIDINEEIFPDENFRAFLKEQPYGQDSILTEEEIKNVVKIDVYQKNITSLKGIEYFSALTTLICSHNQLASLDVSNNTALTELGCSFNQLTSLDVSKNTALTSLQCSLNQLTSLDVSKNTTLTSLNCRSNKLASLDVSKNTALTSLNCIHNQLTSLDVSKNTALTSLLCGTNNLTSLDVSKNTALTELDCSYNQLTSLDVSINTALTSLWCGSNKLTSLDVSKNILLSYLSCYCNQIKGEKMDGLVSTLPIQNQARIDIIKPSSAQEGNICTKDQVNIAKERGWWAFTPNEGNYEGSDPTGNVVIINEENFPDEYFRAFLLKQSYGENGVITDEEINSIKVIDVSNKEIKSLEGIESFTALTSLNCSYNQLTSLEVSGCTALTELNCDVNQLKSLEVSGCTALTSLRCYNNQVTSLDVSKNTALTNLSCSYNQLTSLDVSKCTALTYLDCGYNQLTSLDVSNNTALGTLVCGNNQLTNLDVSKNTALTYLNCYKNQLASLNVSENTALAYLSCGNNQLTSLDVSKNLVLQNLYCYDNKIKGEAMDALVGSLPIQSSASISVIDLSISSEENVCTTIQVNVAKEKGWSVMAYTGQWWVDYKGSVPSGIQGITLDKNANVPVYDLNGRRLKEPRKGINIIDGKTVVVK